MFHLAAFADEIDPSVTVQADVCRRLGVGGIELRSADGVNVLDLTDAAVREASRLFADHGLRVICIGSPIGKVPVDAPWPPHRDRFLRALERAHEFKAGMVRVFSFYAAADGARRESVVHERFRELVPLAAAAGVTLVHENEKDIHGDLADACLRLLRAVDSPHLRAAFDFANFVQVGEDPWRAWLLLRDWVTHIHVKDARRVGGQVVPAGEGDGEVGRILADAAATGYHGFLSLEPHLSAAGPFSGFSGPRLFESAVAALRRVLAAQGLAAS